jgi:hypothetical protein
MARRLALLAVLGLLAAASAAAGGNAPQALWPDGAGHVHSDHHQHAGLGFGMELVSHTNIGQAIGEVDVAKDATGKTWILVAMLSGGFALVDGTDPANPVLVSKVQAGSAYGADAKISDDSTTVFMSLQGGGANCDIGDLPVVPMLPRKMNCGAQLWDTTNKASPTFLGTQVSSTGGSHMMDYEVMNGIPTIAMAGQGAPGGQPIAHVLGNKVSVGVGRLEVGGNHDVTLAMDPLMPGRALAIVANAYSGVRVFDITAAAAPILLGEWRPAGSHYMHTVMLTTVEGKRVIAAAEECFGGGSVPCTIWFLDATDYGNMQLLGQWRNPDGRTPSAFVRWSAHNFNIADGKLYMGHYHGGVVVLDVSTLAKLANPPLVGNYLPAKPRVSGSFSSDVPYVWDAYPVDGVVWVSDINTGLYAVRLTA